MENKKYFAFISYKREDEEWAKWFQNELENYHLPSTLNGRTDISDILEEIPEAFRPPKKDFRPVFRDIDELKAGNLPEQIYNALQDSLNLVVICSPRSAKSEWVNKEIHDFIDIGEKRGLGNDNVKRIFPFIVDGIPHAGDERECFPKVLRELSKEQERIGGNVNEGGSVSDENRERAFVKVLSGMLPKELTFDSLWNRYDRDKKAREVREKEQRDKLLIAQSRFLAEKANQLVDEGDSYLARLLALEALPKDVDNHDRPYVPEAEAALRLSLTHESAILKGHASEVKSVMISSNEDYILSVDDDRTIRVWNIHDGRCTNEYSNIADAASFIPQLGSNIFVSITKQLLVKNNLQVWDITKNEAIEEKQLRKLYRYYDRIMCFSPDGEYIYTVNKDAINIWNVREGQLQKTIQRDEFRIVSCIAAQNNKRIACGFRDKSIRIIDIETEDYIIKYQEDDSDHSIDCIAFNSDGSRMASSSWKSITLWDTSENFIKQTGGITSKNLKLLDRNQHDSTILSLSFSHDDHEIISSSRDHTIIVWNIESGESEILKGHLYDVNSVCLSSDDRIISASSDKTIRIWGHGRIPDFGITVLPPHTIWGQSCAFSPNRLLVAVPDDKIVMLLDAKTGACRRTFVGHEQQITQVAFSPLGNTLITTSLDNSVRLWKIDEDDNCILDYTEDAEMFIAFSSDGKMALTGGRSEKHVPVLKIWNLNEIWDKGNKNPIKTCPYHHEDLITATTFSHDNKSIIALGLYGNLYELGLSDDAENKCPVKVLEKSIVEASILITPDNKYVLFTSGIGDWTNTLIYVWDRNKNVMRTLEGHTARVRSISLNSTGRLLVSASEDQTVKIWDIESGVLLKTFYGHTAEVVNAVFFDDEHIISVSRDNTIITWEFPSLKQLINATYDRFKKRKLTDEEKKKYYLE